MTRIFSLIETAKANGADPYFYLKYLMEQLSPHLYDKGNEYMPDLMPWSDTYRRYEAAERLNQVKAQAPPGNEKPRTPRKRDKIEEKKNQLQSQTKQLEALSTAPEELDQQLNALNDALERTDGTLQRLRQLVTAAGSVRTNKP